MKGPKRDWYEARQKAALEFDKTGCRNCHQRKALECAHVIGRANDRFLPLATLGNAERIVADRGKLVVEPDRIIPLCADCHRAYDSHQLNILPLLSMSEQLQAVADAGSVGLMVKRTTGKEIPV